MLYSDYTEILTGIKDAIFINFENLDNYLPSLGVSTRIFITETILVIFYLKSGYIANITL